MPEFLIIDYTQWDGDKNTPLIYRYITLDQLWDELEAAKAGQSLIAVYEIGKCLLDWS